MSDTTIGLDQTEEEMLAYEVSDETLETAAGTGSEKARNYTLLYCTALSLCPGPYNRRPGPRARSGKVRLSLPNDHLFLPTKAPGQCPGVFQDRISERPLRGGLSVSQSVCGGPSSSLSLAVSIAMRIC